MSFLKDFFRENGELSEQMDAYEARPQQIRMSQAVDEAIKKGRNLIAEAGTGIGKTIAYLVPLILWGLRDGGRIVVSTYTKALQNQIYVKDLPFLKKVLGKDFRYALCLGSENYVCLRKAKKIPKGIKNKQVEEIRVWLAGTDTGILSDLDFMPDGYVRNYFSRESYLCPGRKCSHYKECFYMRARFYQSKAHVLIVNHSLLFSDLASGTKVLPDFDALVLDEAHTVEEVATSHFGKGVAISSIKFLCRQITEFTDTKKTGQLVPDNLSDDKFILKNKIKYIDGKADSLKIRSEEHFGVSETSVKLNRNEFYEEDLSTGLLDLSEKLFDISEKADDMDTQFQLSSFAERARVAGDDLKFIFGRMLDNYVYWVCVEKRAKGADYRFCATPVQIGDQMKEYLFGKVSPVILTSATLSIDDGIKKNFSFLKNRLGLEDCDEISLDSPFDYENNVLVYAPEGIPDPNADYETYKQQVSQYILSLFDVLGGRIFALFTSYQMLDNVSEMLKSKIAQKNILKQGDMPRYVLLDVFKRNPESILLGTTTFWQGVDVPGSSLECVILTKFPFASPSNPIIAARIESIKNEGRNPFMEYQLPQAVIMFKQGFGRLVRSKTDRGAVVVLDPRIYTKFYGKAFMNAIPRCRYTKRIGDVADFFNT